MRLFLVLAIICFADLTRAASAMSEDEVLAAAYTSREPPEVVGAKSDLESRALEHAGPLAQRDGNRLILNLAAGKYTLEDAPNCVDPALQRVCGTFKLLAFAKARQRALVLMHDGTRGTRYLVVNALTGAESEFQDFPHLSPSGKWAFGLGTYKVTGDNPPPAYESGPHVELWTDQVINGYRLSWGGAPAYPATGTAAYRFGRWIDDDTFEAAVERDGKVLTRFQMQHKGTWEIIGRSN